MENYSFIALFVSFLVVLVCMPKFIDFLVKKKAEQSEREDGPESHLKKQGTPTMGGVVIILGIVIGSLCVLPFDDRFVPILIVTVAYGAIGFADDYLKVMMKNTKGLRAWQKMLMQFIVMGAFGVYLYLSPIHYPLMHIPFMGGKIIEIGWPLYFVIMFFAVLGTVNGANFTDGVDGLASSVTIIIAGALIFASVNELSGYETICFAVIGALLGFLVYNSHPAKVFMGDTGSLALGGFVAATAYMLDMPLILLFIAFIYLIEILSVIIQVSYFKITHGKRVFKMAPIHHHFELCGMSETQVVYAFVLVTAFLSVIAYIGL